LFYNRTRMETGIFTPHFIGSPQEGQFIKALSSWLKIALPAELNRQIGTRETQDFWETGRLISQKLDSTRSSRTKAILEKLTAGWLYDFIRLNIKRGRFFNLREVSNTGLADCLGYAKVFTVLGRYCGLDAGVVEVVIDNRGRIVPHTAVLVRNSGGRKQIIDFWYGSLNIKHRRLGLRVKKENKWTINDLDNRLMNSFEDINYLPDVCVYAITLYVEGNRFLKEKQFPYAIAKYSQAIRRYPQNARFYYNRALAYENLGQPEKANKDYARSLRDDADIIRTLATQPVEIVELLRLDEKNIPEVAQQIFLLSRGFITGRKVSAEKIARKMGLSTAEVENILKLLS
jgi:tetratricopeptide (TPR) repeat protein